MTTPQSREPFFIVGCGRSGSTLLQTLLDAHPNLAIPPESQIYYRLGQFVSYYGDLRVRSNRRRFTRDVLNDSLIRAWRMDVSVEDVERVARSPSRAGIFEALFQLYAEQKGATRWGDKTPEHVRHLDLIGEDFPNAKLIHLVRDGRDAAEAFQRMIYGPVSPLGLGRLWRREVMAWRGYGKNGNPENLLEVRYEDLVTQPQEILHHVLQFIGEPFVNTTESYSETALSESYGSQAWHSSLQRGISASKVGIYRQRFTKREIELFEWVAGDALSAYGYRPDHERPQGPKLRNRLHALVADRVVRWYRKARHPEVFVWDLQLKTRTLRRRFGRSLRFF